MYSIKVNLEFYFFFRKEYILEYNYLEKYVSNMLLRFFDPKQLTGKLFLGI